MFRRIFAVPTLTALAVLAALVMSKPALAQQGEHLYEWSGRWARSANPIYATPVYPAPSPAVPPTGYQSFYPGEGSSVDRPALINVSVPAGAEIWFGDAKMTLSGARRQFVSPPVTPGHDYVYEVTAKWTEAGKNVTRSRRVIMHAGDVIDVTFSSGDVGNTIR
jgi:uncharacterized protein (TIGR03000 family)